MSKCIHGADVGVYIEGHGEKPVVVLYIAHTTLTRTCEHAEHAEFVYSEVAHTFDLWEEDKPKWIPEDSRAKHPAKKCWCGEPASPLASGVLDREWCHEHAPRCRSGAHFHGNCQCKGAT